MFWKSTAWSWDDTAGADDDDDGGFLLAADLGGTPGSAPEADKNQVSNFPNVPNASTSAGAKEPGRGVATSSRPLGLDSAKADCISCKTTLSASNGSQHLRVSGPSKPPSVTPLILGPDPSGVPTVLSAVVVLNKSTFESPNLRTGFF